MAHNLAGATDDVPPMFARLPFGITRREAARSQLDRAILLWFGSEIAELPSVHTLTIASQGVLSALCRDMKVPISKLVTWLDSQPRRVRDQIRSPQNFFKHGHHKQKQKYKDIVNYTPELTEMFLVDAVEAYHCLFGSASALMLCFALRFSFDHPTALPMKETKAKLAKSVEVEKLGELRKPEFLNKVLPLLAKLAVKRPHLESPSGTDPNT
jgi:hypothetical protein